MKSLITLFAFLITLFTQAQSPKVLLMDGNRLMHVKQNAAQQDLSCKHLIEAVTNKANTLLSMKPVSVMEKAFIPESGSKHDYMSQAPYFWYDSTKPNGLPYKRKDGERNPEIYKITDRKNVDLLSGATRTLAMAWYFTGDEKYAEKAADLLRYWFFNPDTKMNPNLEYAQAIPGVNHGRGIGIIESRTFADIADAALLLDGSASWKGEDQNALKQWYREFLNWMLTSKNGRDEHAAKNNHGTWYYVQVIDYALFTGDMTKAKQLALQSRTLLDHQLTKEGKQPLELERTKALSYSTMNLEGWFDAARLAGQAGVDLYNYQTSKGASLKAALDWLAPYALGEKSWTYQQIEKYNPGELYPILLQAGGKYDPSYYSKAKSITSGKDNQMADLLYGG